MACGNADTTVDPVALHHCLTCHSVVPARRTILTGIRKLPPATIRVIEADGTTHDTRYWDVAFTRDGHAHLDADAWRAALLDSLRQAVDRRTVADVPVGVLLKLAAGARAPSGRQPAGSCPTRSSTAPRAPSRYRPSATLSGPMLDQVGDALTGRAGRDRGLFSAQYIARLLDEPNATRTTFGANALWQFALRELWLQKLGVG